MSADNLSTPPRIVVGVDGSESSVDALQWAARIATLTGAKIDAVTCWQYPNSIGIYSPPVEWDAAADAAQISATAVKTAFAGSTPEGLRVVVIEGHPAQTLLKASADSEMLVIGSRGHGGFMGLMMGSVSAYCAEHALCPVLVTRTKPDQIPAAIAD